jgi:L-fuconolactonase
MIIDAQIHANAIEPAIAGDRDGVIRSTVVALDAVGIDRAILDDFEGFLDHHYCPGHFAANGAWRADLSFSRRAVELFPERFRYLARVEPDDPDMSTLIAALGATPACAGLRFLYGPGHVWLDPKFATGGYDEIFALASEHNMPVFLFVSGRVETVVPYAKKFPNLSFVVDHTGVLFPATGATADRLALLDPVVDLAQYENIYVKWCHVEYLCAEPYPFVHAMPGLRRVIDAFGANRVMWATDYTMARRADLFACVPPSYAQLLYYIACSEELSADEKSWILGKTIASLTKWPLVDDAAART